jgi:peptidoglycan/xylan/chitin deacetylase (PgdA/CDA1 family)
MESHSLDHVELTKVSQAELNKQLKESKRILEENLGRPVKFICYPAGKYNPQVIAAVNAAGYEAGITVNNGLAQFHAQPFELNRIRVRGTDTLQQLSARFVPPDWKYSVGRFGR